MTNPRPTAVREQIRAALRRAGAHCSICSDPIDYDLPHTDPMSFQADHTVPLAHGGPNALENSTATHKRCNLSKGARPDESPINRGDFLNWPTV